MNDSAAEAEAMPLAVCQRLIELGEWLKKEWRAGRQPALEVLLAAESAADRPFLLQHLLELESILRAEAGETPQRNGSAQRFGGPFQAGQTVGGYELLAEIGRGGMGVVFRARQLSAGGRIVAVKCIRPDSFVLLPGERRDQAVRRFQTEVNTAAKLEHENLVTLHEAGEAAGCPYFSMQYVEGGNLAELLHSGPLANERTAELLEPVARAVHHAHAQGIFHRDLKPGNMLLDQSGKPYVADFGLAKIVEPLQMQASASRRWAGHARLHVAGAGIREGQD